MDRACSTNGIKRNTCMILVGKPEGERPLRRPRRRWVGNIKIHFREMGWDGVDSAELAQDHWRALVNTVMNIRVPLNVGKFLSSCTTGGFSMRAQLHRIS
jgi:hypothetical protein